MADTVPDNPSNREMDEKLPSPSQGRPDHLVPPTGVWLKLDVIVLPVVTLMFFLSSLDRGNIGNANIAGLAHDLKITPAQYSIALTVTLIPYSFFNFVTNLLMKITGPRRLLPTLAVLWGLTTPPGVVSTYGGLLACRFFIGTFEGGLLPGISLYLASFYPRAKLQLRASILFSATSFASAFSGLLAAAIIKMDGVGGRPGWAWLFILEGCFTVLFGLASYFLLPNSPISVPLLTEAEKAYVVRTLHKDGIILVHEEDKRYTFAEIRRTFTRPHVLLVAAAAFFNGATVGALGYFLPLIIVGLGWSGSKAQLMSVPPFAAAAALSVLSSYLSDHFRQRGLTMIFFALMATAGFAVFLASFDNTVRYGSLFLVVPGGFGIGPPLGTWVANNAAPLARRATAIAFTVTMTNLGALLVVWLFGTLSPAPRYESATAAMLAFQLATALCAACNLGWLARENRRRAGVRAERGEKAARRARTGTGTGGTSWCLGTRTRGSVTVDDKFTRSF
ncbi:MFS general substrate transporter [Epithele typhae]|uniref:MFS general substrate transporter n=1 Tax=Epithele typhae TaxID=378194 RepID=UPI0020078719|nr:MFS general substrate transporter [Epithele typhae]KAH9917680.1 MFS general substrate transporter [Epithele typhae]